MTGRDTIMRFSLRHGKATLDMILFTLRIWIVGCYIDGYYFINLRMQFLSFFKISRLHRATSKYTSKTHGQDMSCHY